MANTYKNATARITGAGLANGVTLYTAPSATTTIVNDIIVSNASATVANQISVVLNDNSASTEFYIISGAALPTASNFSPLPGSLVLEQNDSLKAHAVTADASGIHVIASVLEIT